MGWPKGRRRTKEHTAKLIQAIKGRKHSPETIERMRAAALARPAFTDEARRNMSEAARGRTDGHLERLRLAKIGTHHTDESRAKMSAAHRGVKRGPHTDSTKAKIAAAHTIPLVDRFWNKVAKSDGCWLWSKSAKGASGYGNAYIGMRDGKMAYRSAHRVSYELTYGPIPKGMYVLHTCDVRLCVRPDHLFLGTQRDNIRDMMAKSRDNFRGRRTRR